MNVQVEPGLVIRTAVVADLPALQQVYRAASLSNAGDAFYLAAGFVQSDQISTELGTGLRMSLDLSRN